VLAVAIAGCGRSESDKRSKKAPVAPSAILNPVASAPATPTTTRKWNAPERAADCERILREVCGERMCETFDVTRPALEARKQVGCLVGEVGACGDGKFIDYASGFDSISLTFDAAGKATSIEVRTDTTEGCTVGPKRACTAQSTGSFCPTRPLSEHCGGKPCPNLTDTLERYTSEGGCPPGATIDKLTCGAFAVVDERSGAASVTRYFDARGNLVAAQAESPEIRAAMKWGDMPKCATAPGDRICPAPAKPPPKKRKK
jgi:hypothetical protein